MDIRILGQKAFVKGRDKAHKWSGKLRNKVMLTQIHLPQFLYNNRRAGIGLRTLGGAKTNIKVVIENNKIYGNLKAGMRLSKLDEAKITHNTIFDNTKAGIAFFNVDEAIIEDNEISSNLTAGMRLLNVPSATLRRNHVYNNLTAGINFIGREK